MKSTLIQVPQKENYSFRVTLESAPYFFNPYHHHDELELTFVLKSKGQRFVGESVERFEPGDMVLVGANVPHCWKNDEEHFLPNSKLRAEAIVVQFKADFAGEAFFALPELKSVKTLIENAKMGIKFSTKNNKSVQKKLNKLLKSDQEDRIILLISILKDLVEIEEKVFLSRLFNLNQVNYKNLDRLNRIFKYTLENINENVSLSEVSSLIGICPHAFCRYFKLHTRKTYKEFVNEIRISNVCRMLRETELSVNEIAYSNGFSSLSHFTRTFKRYNQYTPSEYRKKY